LIVALDLDDTLYPEEAFVRSGFEAVAAFLNERWAVGRERGLDIMWSSLAERGRGSQFDDVVEQLELRGRQSVAELVRVYRYHPPSIALPEASRLAVAALAPRPLYIVTDGHKLVQQSKIDALGLRPLVRHVYITHRYGIRHRKPSPRVFELMAGRERASLADIVYVGDDPSKDFRGIRPRGARTIRVLTGRHASVAVAPEEDAERTVADITEVPAVVTELEATR